MLLHDFDEKADGCDNGTRFAVRPSFSGRFAVEEPLAGSLIQHRLLLRLDDGRYQLGAATFMLGALYQRSLNVGDILVPLMRELAETSGESVSFYVRDEAVRVCLHRVDSTHAVRFHVREGDVLPLESGSGGLALLAFGVRGFT
ncbi:hypothetical protein PQR46_36265 [Paraburkholderia sediminicola]|uniref:IclR family transcriptional regulator domain-containing protein n=1 Tax=Paraburkholderia TaxID=1822464 RepID=UPI0038BBBBE3